MAFTGVYITRTCFPDDLAKGLQDRSHSKDVRGFSHREGSVNKYVSIWPGGDHTWHSIQNHNFHKRCYLMSRCMRKLTICICEDKGADQLRGNCEADQRLCFRYSESTITLFLKSEISSFYTVFYGCTAQFVSDLVETQTVGFLTHRL